MNKSEIKAAWSKAVNDKKNRPYKDSKYGNKIEGKISAVHYIMYNAIRGLRLDRGFTDNTDPHKFKYKVAVVKGRINGYKRTLDKCSTHKWYKEHLNLEAFGISIEDFEERWDEAVRLHSSS